MKKVIRSTDRPGLAVIVMVTAVATALYACGGGSSDDASANDSSANAVRALIASETPGGIPNLVVPATDAGIPVPAAPVGYSGRFDTTEAKRFLGKLLFHDPVRTQRVNINAGQPLDFPKATAFGGTIGVTDSADGPPPSGTFGNATTAQIEAVRMQTVGTGSCGSCHIGESGGKAGQLLNFNTGGEGRGYTDEAGRFIPRRRPMESLIKLRQEPLFPGDALVDSLPTLTDIFMLSGERIVTTPALFYHNIGEPSLSILQSGRLDQLDSVGRLSPSMVGFAFNNRLLFGGFGGEPSTTIGSLQPTSLLLNPPFDDPAQENLTFLLLDAHRQLGSQNPRLQAIPAFIQAFREAFPAEAAKADASGGTPNDLINDFTVARATSSFLRTASPETLLMTGSSRETTRRSLPRNSKAQLCSLPKQPRAELVALRATVGQCSTSNRTILI